MYGSTFWNKIFICQVNHAITIHQKHVIDVTSNHIEIQFLMHFKESEGLNIVNN